MVVDTSSQATSKFSNVFLKYDLMLSLCKMGQTPNELNLDQLNCN